MKNLAMLALAAKGLEPLGDGVVFVGGATLELYLAGGSGPGARATDDVDCVVEVASRSGYHELEAKLRSLGFKHCSDSEAPLCRWEFGGILVDVMPLSGDVLGFTNRWYAEGFERRIPVGLPGGRTVQVFSLPYFLASKLEAFDGRGRGDFLGSPDIEDVVTLIDGAPDFRRQVSEAPESVKAYLTSRFRSLLADERFLDALEGHLPPAAGPGRAARALSLLEESTTPDR